MSDTPKLMVAHDMCRDYAQEMPVPSVVVWLREQGAGEEVLLETMDGRLEVFDDDGDWVYFADGRYLVIPLDTEPPKEDG